jgi:hypothetical protein
MKKITALCFCLFAFLSGFSQSVQTSDEEFVGPFSSWLNVKDFGALGNGTSDATAAIQSAIDRLSPTAVTSSVVFLPAGTYRITSPLKINGKINISLIGADPATTKLVWGGASGGTMVQINGTSYSRFNRMSFEGNNTAAVAVDQSWDGGSGFFDTGNEYAEDVFSNVGTGIKGGFLGNGFAETAITRCSFLNNSVAGVSLGNFNALDCWIWESLFENCARGVTNYFGAGNFKVYHSIFRNSSISDVSIGNTGEFSIRDCSSVNSKTFFQSNFTGNPSNLTIQGNTIIDPIDNTVIYIRNQGPATIYDNVFRSRANASGPVIISNAWPSAHLAAFANTFTVTNPVSYQAGFSYRNSISTRDNLQNLQEQPLPRIQPNNHRQIFEVPAGSDAAAIQNIINAATASGNRSIVHLPHGTFNIITTLTIPSGSDIQLVGDGNGDRNPTWLYWRGQANDTILVVKGPSKAILKDFSMKGALTNLVLTNIDQAGSRVYMDQMQAHGNKTNLLVNGLNNTKTLVYNSGFSSSTGASVDVIGGNNPQQGKTILFAGAESNNVLSHKASAGAKLMIRDYWYESNTQNHFLDINGVANVTVEGSHMASPPNPNDPQVSITNLNGRTEFLTNNIENKIIIGGDGTMTHLYALSTLAHLQGADNSHGDYGYIVNNSPSADVKSYAVRIFDDNHNTSGSGSFAGADIGPQPTEDIIADILQNARSVHAETISSLPAGVTDVRMYRIWSSMAVTGVELQGTNREETAIDNIPPTIVPKDITLNINNNEAVTIKPADVIQSITDNSGIDNSSVTVSKTQFTCSGVATTFHHQSYAASTTTGVQDWRGELGMAFKVNNPSGITIDALGAFDHQGDGITGTQNGGVRVAIFNKVTQSIVPGLDAIVTGQADGYNFGHRFKSIQPVTLPPGDYVVVAKGYNQNELNGNSGMGSPVPFGDLANGAITVTNNSLYGDGGSGFHYPTYPDYAKTYLAGSFSFSSVTAAPANNIYTVTITAGDIYGNVAQASAKVTVLCGQPSNASLERVSASTGSFPLAEALKNTGSNTLSIFPNPTKGRFSLQLSNLKVPPTAIEIVNENGIVINKRTAGFSNNTKAFKVDLDLSKEKPGLYYVKVYGAEGISVGKIVLVN